MTRKQAIERLRSLSREVGSVARNEDVEAIDLAIAALKAQPNYKRLGAKGGTATFKRFGKKGMKRFGKRGGRPSTVLEEARKLGVTIPEGVSRQRAWQIVQEAKKEKS
jgi:hypothetical protein